MFMSPPFCGLDFTCDNIAWNATHLRTGSKFDFHCTLPKYLLFLLLSLPKIFVKSFCFCKHCVKHRAPAVSFATKSPAICLSRRNNNIINLHLRRVLRNDKLEPQVKWAHRRREGDCIILERTRSEVTSIHGVHR